MRVGEAVANVDPLWRTAERQGVEENCLDVERVLGGAVRNRRKTGSWTVRARERSEDDANDEEDNMMDGDKNVQGSVPESGSVFAMN